MINYGVDCESQGRNCEITFTPSQDLENAHIYYELDSFYSNYRSVVTTLPLYSQLRGEEIDEDQCQSVSTVDDLNPDLTVYSNLLNIEDLTKLPKDTLLNPCGILPKYVFTDSF